MRLVYSNETIKILHQSFKELQKYIITLTTPKARQQQFIKSSPINTKIFSIKLGKFSQHITALFVQKNGLQLQRYTIVIVYF